LELLSKFRYAYEKRYSLTRNKMDASSSAFDVEKYIESEIDPTIAEQIKAEYYSKSEDIKSEREDVLDAGGAGDRILVGLVGQAKQLFNDMGYQEEIGKIAFGTVPGGGLDAFAKKVPHQDQYAIIIPRGFFFLSNLICKLIVLLQPLTTFRTEDGKPVAGYMPSASITQFSLAQHPYIQYRARNCLRAFFGQGFPTHAFSYKKRIPHQERFGYILNGVELFLICHEIAHVVLSHCSGKLSKSKKELELAADALAFDALKKWFDQSSKFGSAHASLCSVLFLQILRMWENGITVLLDDENAKDSHTHPTFEKRFENIQDKIINSGGETPKGYIFLFNACRIATQDIPNAYWRELKEYLESSNGISARVLPHSYQGQGSNSANIEKFQLSEYCNLLNHKDRYLQRLGRYFVSLNYPESGIILYEGILNDDDEIAQQAELALISIQPIYRSYLPRLKERLREEREKGNLETYVMQISSYLSVYGSHNISETARKVGPMHPDFFVEETE